MDAAVAFGHEGFDQLVAVGVQRFQPLLLGGGPQGRAVVGEHTRINGIGLGALALGAGEGPHAPGFDDGEEYLGLVQGARGGAFVTAGGFTDDLRLDRHTVKELEQQCMREQLRRVGLPGPKVIGIDEISILAVTSPSWRPSQTKTANPPSCSPIAQNEFVLLC